MRCCDCIFHNGIGYWNRCDLTESEFYHEYYNTPCPCIDDNYIFIKDCEEMGFIKGKSVIELLKGCKVRHGRWISNDLGGYKWAYYCSECGWVDGYPFNDRHKYCPNCGAKMDDKE